MIDSQSVKTTESGGQRGYDAAKKIKGRKRHIVTDTGGLLVGAEVHPADIQDRDGIFKNMGLIGGFLYVAAFGAGEWSLDAWRSRRRAAVAAE